MNCHISEIFLSLQEAVTYCDNALSLDSSHLKSLLRRAKAHEDMGNYSLAVEDLKSFLHVLRLDPEDCKSVNHRVSSVSALT